MSRLAAILVVAACAAPVPTAPAPVAAPAPQAALPAIHPAEAAPTARPVPPRLAEPPGFVDAGPAPAGTRGTVYLTLSLNINDFLRPEREARAVREWLALTESLGITTVETSFTGEVFDALGVVDPALDTLLSSRRPTINQHLRLLEYRKVDDVAHQLFRMDVGTLELDRRAPGPLLAVQKRLGVTPRDGGGPVADALRATWTAGPGSAALRAAGVAKVDKGETTVHPNTVVGGILAGLPTHQEGHGAIDAWARAYRFARARRGGAHVGDVDTAIVDLGYQVHLALAQGWDVSAMPAVTALVNPKRLGGFLARPERWVPSEEEAAAIRSRPDAKAALDAAFDALCAATCPYLTPDAELTMRLGALDPGRSWVGRISWHATDAYSVEPWSQNLYGPRWGPDKLVPAATRGESEQAAIQAGQRAFYAAAKADPRVQFVSPDNDTQWSPANAPGPAWKAAFGLDLGAFPAGFDAQAIEDAAAAKGFVAAPSKSDEQGLDEGRRPKGGRGRR